ncbi:hypothetical protein ACOME3_004623 [Neoechinorhynchus agilis]
MYIPKRRKAEVTGRSRSRLIPKSRNAADSNNAKRNVKLRNSPLVDNKFRCLPEMDLPPLGEYLRRTFVTIRNRQMFLYIGKVSLFKLAGVDAQRNGKTEFIFIPVIEVGTNHGDDEKWQEFQNAKVVSQTPANMSVASENTVNTAQINPKRPFDKQWYSESKIEESGNKYGYAHSERDDDSEYDLEPEGAKNTGRRAVIENSKVDNQDPRKPIGNASKQTDRLTGYDAVLAKPDRNNHVGQPVRMQFSNNGSHFGQNLHASSTLFNYSKEDLEKRQLFSQFTSYGTTSSKLSSELRGKRSHNGSASFSTNTSYMKKDNERSLDVWTEIEEVLTRLQSLSAKLVSE